MDESRSSSYSISVPHPPPPAQINTSGSVGSSSSDTTTSPNQETSPKVAYRRHTRKKSSQVLIPPVQPRRRSSSDEVDEISSSVSDYTTDQNGSEVDGMDGYYFDDQKRRGSVVTGGTFASAATLLIGAQFFAKLITFSLNQALLKFVNPALFGASAQLEFFINTILFFSREAVRLATLRQSLNGKRADPYRFEGGVVEGTLSGTIQQVINIGFVPMLVGVPLSIALGGLYYFSLQASTSVGDNNHQQYMEIAVLVFGAASLMELASEPLFLVSQLQTEFKKRAIFESISVVVRCVLTFVFVLIAKRHNASIIAFALGQLAYSTVLSALYIGSGVRAHRHKQYKVLSLQKVWREDSDTAPTDKSTKRFFDPDTKQLAISIWLQTIFKHLLSEGDKLLVGMLLQYEDQGIYALVSNYGSLVARLVFLPVEDTLRNGFSKLLSPPVAPHNAALSVDMLSTVLRLYSYFSLFALIFGPVCAPLLFKFLVSSVWVSTDAPHVLAVYTCFVPFLALNGALEAFVQSVASPADIKRQGTMMMAFSLSFGVAAYLLMSPHVMNLGATGLVYANMFNMVMRILWCCQYINRYYSGWQWLRKSCPNYMVLCAGAACEAVTLTYVQPVASLEQLVHNVGLAMALLSVMVYNEPELIQQATSKYIKKRRASGSKPSGVVAETIVEEKEKEAKDK